MHRFIVDCLHEELPLLRRLGLALTAGVLSVGIVAPAMGIPVVDATTPQAQRAVAAKLQLLVEKPVVRITAAKSVTEGDRLTVRVRVGSAKQARTVQLLMETKSIFGSVSWEPVKRKQVKGKASQQFVVTVTDENHERYRARVTYKDRKAVTTSPVRVTVWRWINLIAFRPYSSTGGVWDSFHQPAFTMNGTTYHGWQTFSSYPSWESGYTPGRNCKAFRGDLGVTDSSADGSSATITVMANDTRLVYASPSLTPGMVKKVTLNLAKPYRFSIQARNTSPDSLRAYPAIGNPQFLCTY